MASYRPTTSSGGFSNGANAYDTGANYRTTSASGVAPNSQDIGHTWQFSASISNMTALTLNISYDVYCFSGAPDGADGWASLDYSWDGTTWNNIRSDSPSTGGTGSSAYLTFTIPTAGLSGKNLNTLRVSADVAGGWYVQQVWDPYTDSYQPQYYDGGSSISVYDIYADASTSASTRVFCSTFGF